MSMTYKIEIVGGNKADILKLFEELKELDFSLRLTNLTSKRVLDEIVYGDNWD